MELSIREARAQFAKAIAAAQRGERVTITKNGEPVAELVPATAKSDFWARHEEARRKLGLDKIKTDYPLDEAWRERFDDPAFSREVLGLGDDWDPTRR